MIKDNKVKLLDGDQELSDYDLLGDEALEDYDDDAEPSLSSGEVSWDPSLQYLELKDPDSIVEGKKLYCAKTYEEYLSFIENCSNNSKMSYDIETNAKSPLSADARIIGFSNAFSPNEGVYVLRESLEYTMPDDDWNKITDLLVRVFDSVDKVVVHNCQYEVPYSVNNLKYYFSEDKIEDTMLKCRIVYPKEPAGLKPASAKYLGYGDWDSVLGLYCKSAKSIINYIYWVHHTKNKRNYTEIESSIYDMIFDPVSRITTPDTLYLKLDQLSQSYSGVASKLVMDMLAVMQVFITGKCMDEFTLTKFVEKITEVGKVGLDTSVIPYSMIPMNILSKYGAMDSISTYELDDYMNNALLTKTEEINNKVMSITHNEKSKIDLRIGYELTKKQYFAGINLEMAGAKWNDQVAEDEYDWYNKTAIQSWKNLVTSPLMIDMFRYENRWLFSSKLKDLMVELYEKMPAKIYECHNPDLAVKMIEWLNTKGQTRITKSRTTFYDIVDEQVWNKKTQQYEAGPLVVSHSKLFEKFEQELYALFKVDIDKHLEEVLNSEVQTYSDLKKYYNPSSTESSHYDMVDKILNTNSIKIAMIYDWAKLKLHNDRYWEMKQEVTNPEGSIQEVTTVASGLESTKMMFDFLESVDHVDKEDDPIPQNLIFNKFSIMLDNVNINNDPKLYEIVKISSEFRITSLREPEMISLYNLFKLMGCDVEDKTTWTPEFTWLFDFRMYKKCVKMITSYITGRVGRSSVYVVDKDQVGKLLPKRKRDYYADLDYDNPDKFIPFNKDTEDTIMTLPWNVCTADTGRWKSAMHTIPTGSSIKNIYTSRYKGGVIMAPDYSQMEVRAIACSADEDSMLEAFRNNADIHRMNACFRGDTLILMGDGSYKSLEELSDEYENPHDVFRVWARDTIRNRPVLAFAYHPRKVKTTARRVKVSLSDGSEYHCTYDHKWLNGNNAWIAIIDLVESYSLTLGSSEVKIVSVTPETEMYDVYDLTVVLHHNFIIVDPNVERTFKLSESVADANEVSSDMILYDGPVVHNSQVWRKPPEEVSDAERRFSKMVTFAILYGANAKNIADNFMGGDLQQAEDMLDKFYSAFPKLKTWIDGMHAMWKETGYVTTLTNRIIKIPIPDKTDPKYKYKFSQKLRQAQNFPIQGSSSDIAGTALFMVSDYINSNQMLSKCFSFVHDALYVDIHPYELFKIIKDIHRAMNEYPRKTYNMPVKADMVIGYSMGEELTLDIDSLDVVKDDNDYMEGSMVLSGFKDELQKMTDNWVGVYDEVVVETLEEKDKYINRSELFVPKKAISRWYGLHRTAVKVKITIKTHKDKLNYSLL